MSTRLSRHELARRIGAETGMTYPNAHKVIRSMLGVITQAMAEGRTVEFRGLGVFKPVTRKPRVRNNINLRRRVFVPGYNDIRFDINLELLRRINPGVDMDQKCAILPTASDDKPTL